MGLAWVAKASLPAPPQSPTPVGSSFPELGDSDSFLVMLSKRLNQTREVGLHACPHHHSHLHHLCHHTTITNTDVGYHGSDVPRGFVMAGSQEQGVVQRKYRCLAPGFCFVSNMGAQPD